MVFPERLREGDTVGLVSPAFPVKEEERDGCVKLLEGMGYRVKLGTCLENMYNFHNYLAGDAGARGEDINRMFADPQVKAVFCVRGGYGSSQIMKYLDFDLVKQNPKIFVGYSDITNLHSAFQMFGNLVTFHGPMVCSNMLKDFDAYTRSGLFAALNMEEELEFRNPPGEEGFKTIRGGEAEGILAGGNISVLARACGTFYQLDTRDKILFLEDVEEGIASLDMYITQMEYAGMFEHAAGILLGDFTDCTNDRYDGTYQIEEFLHDRFGTFDLPVMYHIRSGHDKPMGTLPLAPCAVWTGTINGSGFTGSCGRFNGRFNGTFNGIFCGRRWLCHSLCAAFFRLRNKEFGKGCKKSAKKDKKLKKSACNLQRHMINYSSLTAVGMKVQSHIKAVRSCESVAQLDRATAF